MKEINSCWGTQPKHPEYIVDFIVVDVLNSN